MFQQNFHSFDTRESLTSAGARDGRAGRRSDDGGPSWESRRRWGAGRGGFFDSACPLGGQKVRSLKDARPQTPNVNPHSQQKAEKLRIARPSWRHLMLMEYLSRWLDKFKSGLTGAADMTKRMSPRLGPGDGSKRSIFGGSKKSVLSGHGNSKRSVLSGSDGMSPKAISGLSADIDHKGSFSNQMSHAEVSFLES